MKISSYMEKTYKYGIYATLIAILLMLGIPAIICSFYNIWPKPALVASVAGPLLALFVPTTLAGQWQDHYLRYSYQQHLQNNLQ